MANTVHERWMEEKTKKNQRIGITAVGLIVLLSVFVLPARSQQAPVTQVIPILDQVPPTWSKLLPSDKRFELVMNGEAVLDKETGLVWEKAIGPVITNAVAARYLCLNLSLGGRKGWRMPSTSELSSLADPAQSNPALPPGHPFSNVQTDNYYLTQGNDYHDVWAVDLATGQAFPVGDGLNFNGHYWCVRGR